MCGEIGADQYTRQLNVRIVTNGNEQTVTLSKQFQDLDELRLDEIMVTGFNSGTSAACYLQVNQRGLSSPAISDNNVPGTLLMVDVLNPHTVFQRPKVIAVSQLGTIASFRMSVKMPDGTPATFTELSMILTAVMRKPGRASVQQMAYDSTPQIKGVDPRSTF